MVHALGLRALDRRKVSRAGWPAIVGLAGAVPIGLLLGHRWWEQQAMQLAVRGDVRIGWVLDVLVLAVPVSTIGVVTLVLSRRTVRTDALRTG